MAGDCEFEYIWEGSERKRCKFNGTVVPKCECQLCARGIQSRNVFVLAARFGGSIGWEETID